MLYSPKGIICDSLVVIKLMLKTDEGHTVLLRKLTRVNFWARGELLTMFSRAAARLLVYTFALSS